MKQSFDLIFISIEPWDDIWRRNQFVCAELARRNPLKQILFVAPPRDISHRIRRGRVLPESIHPVTARVPGLANVTVTYPLKLFPNSFWIGRKLNDYLARRHVRGVAKKLGLQNPILWLNPHYAVHMVSRMGESSVIYDITDDWTTLTQSRRMTDLIARQDACLCRIADVTIVCSQRLYDLKRHLVRELQLIPNGVDAAHYSKVLDETAAVPTQAALWPKPVLGYTGTVHPDRVDVELISQVARAHSGSVVLIGPNYLSATQVERLNGLGNVFMPGPVSYAKIPNYMAAFDICITPHRMTAFTESLNPIKLWEYLAAGLPIVSTDVAGFRDYPDLVHLARTPQEFIAATKLALEEGFVKADCRRAEAARHSWESRVDQIEAVIQSSTEHRLTRSNEADSGVNKVHQGC